MSSEKTGLKLGTTLFSFTNEFHGREYDLYQLIAKVGQLGLGPGLEIVGFAHVRGFPMVTDAFADDFKQAVSDAGLELSCIGINADLWIDPEHPMNDDESYDYHVDQIEAAAKLGFPVARYQFGAGPVIIERLVPLAEKLNIKLGMEIHAPDSVRSPAVMGFREMYNRVNSPMLGFIPDMGSCARRVAPAFDDYFRKLGIPEKLIELGHQIWDKEGDPFIKIPEFTARARELGSREEHIAEMFMIFGLFSRQEPTAWKEIMPQIVHIHGKFYGFDEQGNESAIPYQDLLPVFVEGGYKGFMSSEWEGHFFSDDAGFRKVQAHHALCRRILRELAPNPSEVI
jgi:hypothetical protein